MTGKLNCPICNSDNNELLYLDTLGNDLPPFDYAFSPEHMRTYKIVKCRACTHAYCVIPHENLWKNYQSIIDPEYISRQEAHLLTAQRVIQHLTRYVKGKKLLDIGCATGDFLSVAKDYYYVEGLELSKWSAEIAKSRGFKVNTCTINELPPDTQFDIITLWGVIEHFENPKAEIESIARILKPGGYVCLWTGDVDSWLARLLGKNWWYIQGQHIQFFSKKSLNRLFSDTGFETVSIDKYPWTTDLKTLSKSFFRYKSVTALAKILLENAITRNIVIKLKLPGEMLAIYRKRD